MPKYRVNLVTVASTTIEVEAADEDLAIDAAFESELPYAPAFANYEFGEWMLSSELFPDQPSSVGDDVFEVAE